MIINRKKMTGALFLVLLPVLSCDAQAAGSRHRGQDALNTRLARELQAAGQRVSEGVVADIASAQARQREQLRLQLEMDSLRVRMAGRAGNTDGRPEATPRATAGRTITPSRVPCVTDGMTEDNTSTGSCI
ncbi:TPA: hypothetical protein H1V70_004810 [Salmonella enterica]|nr:hypothetical protein [Salmonella enterica]